MIIRLSSNSWQPFWQCCHVRNLINSTFSTKTTCPKFVQFTKIVQLEQPLAELVNGNIDNSTVEYLPGITLATFACLGCDYLHQFYPDQLPALSVNQ